MANAIGIARCNPWPYFVGKTVLPLSILAVYQNGPFLDRCLILLLPGMGGSKRCDHVTYIYRFRSVTSCCKLRPPPTRLARMGSKSETGNVTDFWSILVLLFGVTRTTVQVTRC